jgi:flagellar motility protein MotE (MotC chaperone)
MTRILRSSWFVALAGCLLYLGTTAVVLSPAKFAGMKLAGANSEEIDGPSWRFHNPEFDQWVAQVKTEKEELDAREQKLNDLETRLNAEMQEVSTVTQAVSELQANFDRNVVRFQAQEVDNIKHQAKLISAMSPEGAVAMLNQMPDDLAVRILFVMKADDASRILDALSKKDEAGAKHAAMLAEQLHRVLPVETNSLAAQ